MILDTLQNEAYAGYNAATNGLWVNWDVSGDGGVTGNFNGTGYPDPSSGAGARHDPATDLRYLHNLLSWQAQHPGSTEFNGQISRYEGIVKAEFAGTKDPRGWYYDELYSIGTLSGDQWFTNTAYNLAAAYAQQYDPALGTIYQVSSEYPAGFYRTDWALEEGAALCEAGATFHRPQWVSEGESVIGFVRAHAYLAAQGTYLHAMTGVLLSDGAANPDEEIANSNKTAGLGGTVQPSEVAQDAIALLEAGAAANNSSISAQGVSLLNSFSPAVNTLGLWDPIYGGYFENGYFSGTSFDDPGTFTVKNGKKDSKQLAMLEAFHLADTLEAGQPFLYAEQDMLKVATEAYEPTQKGFPYELTSEWGLVRLSQCGCEETWVTSEADGIALEALQAWAAGNAGAASGGAPGTPSTTPGPTTVAATTTLPGA